MRITPRQSTFLIIGLLLIGSLGYLIYSILTPFDKLAIPLTIVWGFLCVGLWFAEMRNWRYVRHTIVVIQTILCTSGIVFAKQTIHNLPMSVVVLLLPAVLATVLLSHIWIIGSACAAIIAFQIWSWQVGLAFEPSLFLAQFLVVGGMVLAKLVMQTAQYDANAHAARADAARIQIEQQAQALQDANQQQEAQLTEQQRLLDVIAVLESPAMLLADGVLFTPILGHVDNQRGQRLINDLVQQAYTQRARYVIIDVSGMATVNDQAVQTLVTAAQALELLGCQVLLTGISAESAMMFSQSQDTLARLTTLASPQEALQYIRSSREKQ